MRSVLLLVGLMLYMSVGQPLKAQFVSEVWNDISGGVAYVFQGGSAFDKPVIIVEGFDPANLIGSNELFDILSQQQLLRKLTDMGYDVIVLDFTDGGASIATNAGFLLVVMGRANNRTPPGNQLVIIGASMGGIVARYTLGYMEQNNIDPNTRLYISFDSPHRGANIPLGLQHFFDFFAWSVPGTATDQGQEILNTPAARELLTYHFNGTSGTMAGPDAARAALTGHLNYQMPSGPSMKKVAVSNGSKIGVGINDMGSCELLQVMGIRLEEFPYVGILEAAIRSVPDGAQACDIFEGELDDGGITTSIIEVSGTLPYDYAPGGQRSTLQETEQLILAGAEGAVATLHPDHCFVPTISALDLDPNITDLFYNVDQGNIICDDLTPFDTYYAPDNNEDHLEITATNAEWLQYQITGSTFLNDLKLQNSRLNHDLDFEEKGIIEAGRSITTEIPEGNFVIPPGRISSFVSAQKVVLKPGFRARDGSSFRAAICGPPANKDYGWAENNTATESSMERLKMEEAADEIFAASIYPNPNSGSFDLKFRYSDPSKRVMMKITDLLGTTVHQEIFAPVTIKSLNLKGLSKGVYLLNCAQGDHHFIRKLIIQ